MTVVNRHNLLVSGQKRAIQGLTNAAVTKKRRLKKNGRRPWMGVVFDRVLKKSLSAQNASRAKRKNSSAGEGEFTSQEIRSGVMLPSVSKQIMGGGGGSKSRGLHFYPMAN